MRFETNQPSVLSDGGPVPTVSKHPSRSCLKRVRKQIIQKMKKTPTTNSDARKHVCIFCSHQVGYLFSLYALLRDGYRCVLTGAYDSYKWLPDLSDRATDAKAPRTNTEYAHVFSESAQDVDKVFSALSPIFCAMLFLMGYKRTRSTQPVPRESSKFLVSATGTRVSLLITSTNTSISSPWP
ncbi:hypothetical protein B0H11DRAFT_304383 [Mycena galericulata]|nr:hypothetical protein B0H11DRAFT_304383 [Mycena galericulata]